MKKHLSISLTLLCLVAILSLSSARGSEPKFGTFGNAKYNSFGGVFKYVRDQFRGHNKQQSTQQIDERRQLEELCRQKGSLSKGARLVNGTNCFEYFPEELSFIDANQACEDLGGLIWVPDIFDGDIYQCFMVEFPEIFSASDYIHTGFTVNFADSPNTIVDMFGNDVSTAAYMYQAGFDGEPPFACGAVFLQNNQLEINFSDCEGDSLPYVCMYSLDGDLPASTFQFPPP